MPQETHPSVHVYTRLTLTLRPLSLSATCEQKMVGIKELASIPLSLVVLRELMLEIFKFGLFQVNS